MMRILLFSLKQSIFLDTSGFIKVLATLELQTVAPRAQKNTFTRLKSILIAFPYC